ncbi:MAG: hypothetical protein AAB729_02845, partial [Patescibacteria group bacterium]
MAKINWGELAKQRIAGKGGEKPDGVTPTVGNGPKKEKLPVNNPEKKKAKNQAEIDKVNEQNEKILRERAEIKDSVDGALRLVMSSLTKPNLNANQRARLLRVQNSVERAKNKIVDGDNYFVEALDASGKITAKRLEGVPVDELTKVVKDLEARTQEQVREIFQKEQSVKTSRTAKDKYELASVRAGINGDEAKKKLAWYEVLSQLPVKDQLKEEAYKEVEAWEEADRKKASAEGKAFAGYDADYKKQQL